MKTQEQREGDAVAIGTALLWLFAVAVLIWVSFVVVSSVTGLEDGPLIVVVWVLFGLASVLALGYLYRHRRG